MEKAKAIAHVKDMYAHMLFREDKEALETLIPELKESEDERIRKYLIEELKAAKSIVELKFTIPQPTREECIAYLEKQKEASKAIEAVDRIDKYIDEHLANAHDMKDSNPDKKYYRGWDDALGKMAGILQDVYSGEKQKEQKTAEWNPNNEDVILFNKAVTTNPNLTPSERAKLDIIRMKFKHCNGQIATNDFDIALGERYIQGYNDGINESRPAEWDEYTKTNLDRALQIIKKAKGNLQGYQTDDGIYECDKAIECLEHFLYRGLEIEKPAEIAPNQFDGITYGMQGYSTEKPAEWSEEDEEKINNISEIIEHCIAIPYSGGTLKLSQEYKKELQCFLKSLRPQPKQEWGEEDEKKIVELKNFIAQCNGFNKENRKKAFDMIDALRYQPKQEWSEKDEDMLNSCISSIEEAKENRYAYKETDGDTSYDHEIDWLKSLRPSWKPSKER